MICLYRFFVVFIVFAVLSISAETQYKWSGGMSGNWSDPANWRDKAGQLVSDYPCTLEDQAFFAKNVSCVVTLTEDIELTRISLESSTKGNPYPVTLKGAYKINASGSSAGFLIGFYREFICDGPRISIVNKDVLCYGNFRLLQGSLKTVLNNGFDVKSGYDVIVEICGGSFEGWFYPRDCSFSVSGGICYFPYRNATYTTFADASAVSFTGGEIVLERAPSHPGLLPVVPGTKLTLLDTSAINIPFAFSMEDLDSLSFGGEIVATNSSSSGLTILESYTIQGGGSLYLSALQTDSSVALEIDLEAIYIGSTLSGTGSSCLFNVRRPLTLGAIGDWVQSASPKLYQWGSLVVDTTDPWTSVARDVALNCFPRWGDLVFRGTGNTIFEVRDRSSSFRSLVLESGSSITLSQNMENSAIQMGSLSLGQGAKLGFTAGKKSHIEPILPADIDPSAKIMVSIAPSLSEEYIYPVIHGVMDVPLAVFELSMDDIADGWGLYKSGSSVYVAKNPVATIPGSEQRWTGTTSGYWSDASNWASGALPNQKATYLSGFTQVVTTNDIENLSITRLETSVGQTGQFTVRGKPITITSGSLPTALASAAIRAASPLPLVIEAPVVAGGDFWAAAMNNSSITLAGGVTVPGVMVASGPINLGGSCSIGSYLADQLRNVGSGQSQGRPTEIRILPGGDVTFESQDETQVHVTPMTVMAGGKLTVNGDLYGWSVSCIHSVDGVLDVHAPFEADSDQYLTGTGLVQIAAVNPSSQDSAVMRIGGGIIFAPGNWQTVTSGSERNTFTMVVEGDATLSGLSSGIYGPGEGVITDIPAIERALVVEHQATLIVDVPEGETFTFNDPIIAKGNIIKRGKGDIILGNAGCDFTGGIIMEEGGFSLSSKLNKEALQGWVPVAVFPADSILPTVSDKYMAKFETNQDGTLTLYMKMVIKGMLLLIK